MRLVFIIAAMLIAAGNAQADAASISACTTSSVVSLVGTTCSIGDKIFNFTDYNALSGSDPAAVLFTPFADDLLTIGFRLSSDAFHAESTQPDGVWFTPAGELHFGLSAMPGALFINAFAASMSNAIASSDPVIRNDMAPTAFTTANLELGTGGNFPDPCTAVSMVGSNTDGPVLINNGCGSVLSDVTSGLAFWEASAGGGIASASMASASYTFHQSTERPVSTPEPSTLLLLCSGLTGLLGVSRRRDLRRRWR